MKRYLKNTKVVVGLVLILAGLGMILRLAVPRALT